MGEKKRRAQRFFQHHPICCFCGGTTPATTIDHVPSIQIFDGKHRPKGLEFPACKSCNHGTKQEEQVVAMVSRFGIDPQTPELEEEGKKIIRSVANNNREVLEELFQLSSRDVRNLMKRFMLTPGVDGSPSQMPIAKANGPLLNRCMNIFGRKLSCALHYLYTGNIIPPDGAIFLRWYSNVDVYEGKIPEDILKIFGHLQTLRQGRFSVENQFAYRHTMSPDGMLSGYFAMFRTAFVIVGLVQCGGFKQVLKVGDANTFGPFEPQQAS